MGMTRNIERIYKKQKRREQKRKVAIFSSMLQGEMVTTNLMLAINIYGSL